MSAPFEGWCILELMGHRRLAGFVTEQTVAGAGFLRIDVPGPDGTPRATQFYPPASVYAMTPTTEELARRVAATTIVAPVSHWELPQLNRSSAPDDDFEPHQTDLVRAKAAALEMQRCGCPSCGACVERLCEELLPALGITDREIDATPQDPDGTGMDASDAE